MRKALLACALALLPSVAGAQTVKQWTDYGVNDFPPDPATGLTNAEILSGLALCKANRILVHNVPMVAPQDTATCGALISEADARKAAGDASKANPAANSDAIKALSEKLKN